MVNQLGEQIDMFTLQCCNCSTPLVFLL